MLLTSRSSARYTRSDTLPARNRDNNRWAGSKAPKTDSGQKRGTKSIGGIPLAAVNGLARSKSEPAIRAPDDPVGTALLARDPPVARSHPSRELRRPVAHAEPASDQGPLQAIASRNRVGDPSTARDHARIHPGVYAAWRSAE